MGEGARYPYSPEIRTRPEADPLVAPSPIVADRLPAL